MKKTEWSRRSFLASAILPVGAAALSACGGSESGGAPSTPNTARVVPRKFSPNEQVRVACIGVGNQGASDVYGLARCSMAQLVAFADVDAETAAPSFNAHPGVPQYTDYRKMLEEMAGEIDAVMVSTPDHTHAPAAYMAMKLGKHVRVQKPAAHTIAEAQLLLRTAREMKVRTAMGIQGHYTHGVRKYCEAIAAGLIGEAKVIHAWTDRPVWKQGFTGPLSSEAVPSHLDWDLWLGGAPERPYNSGYAPLFWRGWWDFGCGAAGDMACHLLDPPYWAFRLGDAPHFSCEVVASEGATEWSGPTKSIMKTVFAARGGLAPITLYWYDGGYLPERPEDLPADLELGSEGNGSLVEGTKGYMANDDYGAAPLLLPPGRDAELEAVPDSLERVPGQDPYASWIDAIREDKPTPSDFEYSIPLTIISNFMNVAIRAGERVEYDTATGALIGGDKHAHLLTKEYRPGWELPC